MIDRVVVVVLVVALAWSSLAFCGEIHEAAKNGDLARVKALLKANPDLVFTKDKDGVTPLHEAAFAGHKDVTELLLTHGAHVNARDNAGDTPLYWAAENAFPPEAENKANIKDVAELLLAKGADVNAKDKAGATPLHNAARMGWKEMADLLLTHGARINAKDNEGFTPLHRAVASGNKYLLELLLDHGAEIDTKAADGETPLAVAAGMVYVHPLNLEPQPKENMDVVEFLLAHKAEVNAKDSHGFTPLHEAVVKGNKDIAELLRLHGGQE